MWPYLRRRLVESRKCYLLCHVRESPAVMSCYAATATHIGPAALGWLPRSASLPLNPLIQLLQLLMQSRSTFSPLLTAGHETPHSITNGQWAMGGKGRGLCTHGIAQIEAIACYPIWRHVLCSTVCFVARRRSLMPLKLIC